MLEKKYQNDHDNGYTYINNATGETIQLTPFMMKEWSRAMVYNTSIVLYNLANHNDEHSMMGRHHSINHLPVAHSTLGTDKFLFHDAVRPPKRHRAHPVHPTLHASLKSSRIFLVFLGLLSTHS